jgi:hypothetical protein
MHDFVSYGPNLNRNFRLYYRNFSLNVLGVSCFMTIDRLLGDRNAHHRSLHNTPTLVWYAYAGMDLVLIRNLVTSAWIWRLLWESASCRTPVGFRVLTRDIKNLDVIRTAQV